MDIVNNILIALHLFGLVMGMGAGIALGVVGPQFGPAKEAERGLLFRIADMLGRNGQIGLAVLWVTGILVVFLKFGGPMGLGWWFWVKIALVVALSASIGIGSAAYRRFRKGDMSAGARMALTGKINKVLGPLVILAAAFAFN